MNGLPPPIPRQYDAERSFNSRGSYYFDGDVPVPRPVSLSVNREAGQLEIGLGQGRVVHWPLIDVREVDDVAGVEGNMLRLKTDPLARLQVMNWRLMREFPALKRRAPPKGRGRLAAWAVAAVVAVAVQIGLLVPMLADNLAQFIPPEGERALGEATLGEIREALGNSQSQIPLQPCENAEGLAVLNAMAAKLTEGQDLPMPVEVSVLDHEMVNAFALPGGYVVFFRGLIDSAESPDEVAAVLAHEIGHVVSRDPTRHALRSAGSIGILGLLFGDFAGGTAVLFLAERLISAQYSQAAETAADEYAHKALEQANVAPAALGDMFERLREKYGDNEGMMVHFITHPKLGDRIDNARAATRQESAYEPIISDEDWQKLKKVCY